MASTPARPPQVTLAGWLVIIGSVVVVVMAFSQVAGLRSLETREAIEEYLSKPPGDSLGLTVTRVQAVLQVALVVAAATAAATAILGWQALQRSRGARVALSALAVPLFVTGLAGGGIAAAVVSAAIVMLWFQPARDWFDGVSRQAPSPARPVPPAAPVGADRLAGLPPPTSPALHPGYGATATAAPAVEERPAAVTWACVVTWLCSLTTLVVLALTVAALLADPAIIDEARRQNPGIDDAGLSDRVLRTGVLVMCALAVVWSAVSCLLALLTWRRVRWAATGLVVSAAVAGAFSLLSLVGSVVMLVPLAACAATVALLVRRESRDWLRPAPLRR